MVQKAFANACAQSRDLRHGEQLFDCQLAALVPWATWKAMADMPVTMNIALALWACIYFSTLEAFAWGSDISVHLKVDSLMYFHFSPELLDWQTGFWSGRTKVQTSFGNIRRFHSAGLLGDGAHCFLCTQCHGLPSLAQQADIMAASLQALLLHTTGTNGVFAPG